MAANREKITQKELNLLKQKNKLVDELIVKEKKGGLAAISAGKERRKLLDEILELEKKHATAREEVKKVTEEGNKAYEKGKQFIEDANKAGKQTIIGAEDLSKQHEALNNVLGTSVDFQTDISSILIDQIDSSNQLNQSQLAVGTAAFEAVSFGDQEKKLAQERIKIMSGQVDLSEKEKQIALETLDAADKQLEVQKKIGKAQQLQHDATTKLGQGMSDIKDQASAFGAQLKAIAMNPVMAIGAGLLLAGKYLYDMFKGAMELKAELGISDEAAAGLQMQISETAAAFKMAGVEAGDVKDAAIGLMDNFGGVNAVTPELLTGMAQMKAELGVSGTNAANLMVAMKATGAASEEAAFQMAKSVGSLAQAEGVAPGQVMQDLAQNTEAFASFAKDGGMNVAKAAIQAKKLGINFDTSVKIADNLLNFESSIQQQMEAEILLGKQLNLDKARQMALSGDMVGLQKEILRNVGSEAEFNQMNVLQRRALAQSIGVSVTELSKMVANQSNLNKQTKSQAMTAKGMAYLMGLIRDLGQDLLEVWQVLKPILMVALLPIGIAVFAVVKLLSGLASIITAMNEFHNIGTLIIGGMLMMWGIAKLTGNTNLLNIVKEFAAKKAMWLAEKLHLTGVMDKGKELAKGAIGKVKDVGSNLKDKMKMPSKTPGTDSNPLAFVEKIDPKKVLAGAAAMLIVAAALFVTAKALQEFGSVEWSSLAKAGVALLGLVLVLVAIGALMMSGVGALAIIAGAAAMLIMAAALLVLGYAIQAIGTGFGMLAEGLSSFSPLMSTLVPLAGGIFILAGAFGALGMGMGMLAIGALALLPALPVLLALGSIGMLGQMLLGGGEGAGAESEAAMNVTDMTLTNEKLDGVISEIVALKDSNTELMNTLTGKVKGLAEG
jgi:hypothetical protein